MGGIWVSIENVKILRGTRQYYVEGDSLLQLEYHIVEKIVGGSNKYYGIEINQYKTNTHREDIVQYKGMLLSESKEWTEDLIDKFIGNGVTPDTMEYIIDDIMGIPC